MPSFAIPHLYRSLHSYLLQRIPDECDTRLTDLIFLMMGIFQSGSVQLNLIARKTPICAKKLSIVKRLARFLDNAKVRVREWYHPFAETLLRSAAAAGQVHLVIDATKVAFDFRLVMVSLTYQRRSLPIAWACLAGSRGHSSTATQVKMMDTVRRLLPQQVWVSLVGDCEFGNPLLIEHLRFWGWDYALRQPRDNLVMLRGSGKWQCLDSLPLLKGQPLWIGRGLLTQASAYPAHLVLCWQPDEDKPWYLATSLLNPRAALRLSRLTLAACLLYLWLVALAEQVITHQPIHEIDRTERRDLSLFRLGWDFLERRLALCDPIPSVSIPNFCLMSGG